MRRNPYFADPEMGAAAGALVEGIFGGSERDQQRARAGLLRSQRDGQELENEQAIRRLNASRRNAERIRLLPAGQSVTGALPELYAGVMEGADPRMMTAMPGFVRGMAVPLVPTAGERDRLALAAGESYQNTEGGRDQAEAAATRRTGISAGATVQAARIGADQRDRQAALEEGGRRDRFERGDAQPGHTIAGTRAVAMGLIPPPADGAQAPAYTLPSPAQNVTAGGTLVAPTPGIVPPDGPRPATIVPGAPTVGSVQGRLMNEAADPTTDPARRADVERLLPAGTIAGVEARGTQALRLQDVRDAGSMGRVLAQNAGRVQVAQITQEGATTRVRMNIAGQEAMVTMRGNQAESLEILRQDGRREIVDLQQAGATDRAQLNAQVQQAIAQAGNASREGIAAAGNASRETIAGGAQQAQRDVAQTNADARTRAAEVTVGGRRYAVEVAADGRQRVAEILADGRRQVVDAQQLGANERAQLDAATREAVTRLAVEGRATEGAANRTSREGIARGNNEATVRAAQIGADGRAAGANRAPAPRLVPRGVAEDVQTEMRDELAHRGFRLNEAATQWVQARAEELLANRTEGSPTRAVRAALDEYRAAGDAEQTGGGWFRSRQYGLPPSLVPGGARPAPTEGGGAPSAAPAPQAAPVDPLEGRTATGPGGVRVIRRNGQWVPVS